MKRLTRDKHYRIYQFIDMHNGDTSVCWEWLGSLHKDGRPYKTINGVRKLVYRITWEHLHGRELLASEVARHTCDNPKCCNPHHIIPGSHQDNMNDMKERERHGLSAHVVRAIRKLISEGRTHKDIAELYGISRETVTAINNGRAHATKT